MLGWEYPPYLNGGLGVATAGLAQALSALVDLTLVLPRSEETTLPAGGRILSLHGQELPDIRRRYLRQESEWLREVRVESVDVSLQGYEQVGRRFAPISREQWLRVERMIPEEILERPARPFFIDQLYGDDVVARVIDYSELVLAQGESLDFDLIHAHDWMTFLAGLQLKARSGKPLVLHVHSLEYDRGGPESRGWIFALEQHALQHADLVIPVSRYTGDILRRIYGISEERLYPVRNGIAPLARYRSARPFAEPLIAFLGRITPQKGPMYFFEAALHLLRERPHTQFVVAGQGEQIEALIRRATAAQVRDRIHFPGFLDRDRVHDLLSMADVFVLPSVSEPFGLAALEAAQLGVPCILSTQSGVAEVLHGALQVDYADTPAMARLMQRLLDDQSLRAQVIATQDRALATISWPYAAKRVVEAYARVI
jgi:glycogen synthase